MSKTGRINLRRGTRGIPKSRQRRHITVRSVRREQPDLRKLARAIIAQALAEAHSNAATDTAATADAASTDTASQGSQQGSGEAPHD